MYVRENVCGILDVVKFEINEVIKLINITVWMQKFLQTLKETFRDRVWFVGLQGSYGRGEATETSDIDVVVILDELSAMDIHTYNTMLDVLPHRELICGFLSGKDEILNWESSDLFQFCYDTTPIKGSLGEVVSAIDQSAVNRAIKISACNIFHGCVHNMLDTLSHRELICGFLSGKKEIMNWEPSDLFQFCHDTTPIKGSLDEVMAVIDENAVDRAIKVGVCNIYHGCVHNMLHEKSEDILRGLYKSASFVVQAIVFKRTGNYISHQKKLLQAVSSDERAIVENFMKLKNGGTVEFKLLSETLLDWSKKWISESN